MVSEKRFNAASGMNMSKSDNRSEVIALINRVRKGDQEAFVQILGKYTPLIESLVTRFAADESAKQHEDDLRQEATLVFYNAINTYDTEQSEVEFGLYAKICITNALVSQLRTLNKRRAEQPFEPGSDELPEFHTEDPATGVVEQENLRALYLVIRKNLSDFEYCIWRHYMSGKTAKEIGAIVGKDEKSVTNAIYRIRKKLRSLLK